MFRATIKGDENSLKIIYKNFNNWIQFENGVYYLISPNSQNNLESVMEYSKETLKLILNMLQVKIDEPCNAEISVVEEINNKGDKAIFLIDQMTGRDDVSVGKYELNEKTDELEILDQQKSSSTVNMYC